MKRKKWPLKAAAAVLVVATLAGFGVLAAESGSQTDPLITLSYLTDTLTPGILQQTDAKITSNNTLLTSALTEQINAFTQQMDTKIAAVQTGGQTPGTSSTYAVVSLNSGQTLTGTIGTEIMLRVGTAACVASSSPGLIDMTDGSTLNNGASLVKNHLYMATIENRGIKATAAVKVLVRGTYTVK
ncbi:hypothetical protein [Papillibacter cinnamivorans]|uniref:Uncharacterized protein n=1 Tax=Papillibacter cinnamivorans DSM 12816 TaxID=1122930 RepID=A0A1W1ZB46_9FIRM|nr:hypothetical protein [Papillibacter cinnamivorans]SMC45556.1 hypothetical protein SAMN02745168_0926 [Papillibacter cinnamivorans DSM 12816]